MISLAANVILQALGTLKKTMLTNQIPKDVHWIAEITESNFFLRSRIVNSFFIHCNSTNQPKSNANYGTGNDQQLKIS